MDVAASLSAHQLRLLSELDEVCADIGMPYVLMGRAAWGARLGRLEQFERPAVEIGVLARDFERLLVELEGNCDGTHRFVDSWRCDPTYGDYSARYMDCDTTYVVPNRLSAKVPCGIHLHIIPLRDELSGFSKERSKLSTVLEVGLRTYSADRSMNDSLIRESKVRAGRILISAARSVVAPERVGADLIRRMGKTFYDPTAPRCFSRLSNGRINWFQRSWFISPREVIVDGTRTMIPGSDDYFVDVFGEKWAERRLNRWMPSRRTICEASVPFSTFAESATAHGVRLEEYVAQRDRLLEMQRISDPVLNKVRRYWDILYLTADRISLAEVYAPRKEAILSLYARGNLSETRSLLLEYSTRLEKHMKKGLGLCFDPELFEVLMAIYLSEGRVNFAASVRASVPQQHWRGVSFKRFDGSVVAE